MSERERERMYVCACVNESAKDWMKQAGKDLEMGITRATKRKNEKCRYQ